MTPKNWGEGVDDKIIFKNANICLYQDLVNIFIYVRTTIQI